MSNTLSVCSEAPYSFPVPVKYSIKNSIKYSSSRKLDSHSLTGVRDCGFHSAVASEKTFLGCDGLGYFHDHDVGRKLLVGNVRVENEPSVLFCIVLSRLRALTCDVM